MPAVGDTEVVPRKQLKQVGENEYGPVYECPRCGFPISDYCDCPECGWAGMCQEEFGGDAET